MFAPNFTTIQRENGESLFTGWRPRYYDRRDYSEHSPEVEPFLKKMKVEPGFVSLGDTSPSSLSLVSFFPSRKSQANLGSCTANAGTTISEYFQNRSFGKSIPGSRLFLYKVTRSLQRETGDSGAYLRTTMAGLALFGIPPESYYPYVVADFDKEPSQFIYSMADNYEATCYFCHDPMSESPTGDLVLSRVKKYLQAGIPSMFGFYIFPSFDKGRLLNDLGTNRAAIPYPGEDEDVEGGHAVVAAGYDDNMVIVNTVTGDQTTGALIFVNSWGSSWGDNGCGYLPYEYVTNYIAVDFWSILSMKWLDTGRFGL